MNSNKKLVSRTDARKGWGKKHVARVTRREGKKIARNWGIDKN